MLLFEQAILPMSYTINLICMNTDSKLTYNTHVNKFCTNWVISTKLKNRSRIIIILQFTSKERGTPIKKILKGCKNNTNSKRFENKLEKH